MLRKRGRRPGSLKLGEGLEDGGTRIAEVA
jgi:hypothetical protein